MTWRPWDAAWHEALYGATGFYRRPEGPAGHFATSAQGIPGAASILAAGVAAMARQAGLTRVVDVGAGRGELLAALHATDPDLELLGLDVVPRPDALPEPIGWQQSPGGAELPEADYDEALVLAHEWLDVVPAEVVEVDDAGLLRVVEVNEHGQERLGDPAPAAAVDWCAQHWPTVGVDPIAGERAEIGSSRERAWTALCDAATGALVVAVDYGHTRDDRPPLGTLTGFRDGGQVAPVPDGGSDVTAHVAVDALTADRRVRQRTLLRELDVLPRHPEHALARTDPTAYLRALAASSAAAAVTASPGLGDFWWVLRRT